jgi:hypothetical protein
LLSIWLLVVVAKVVTPVADTLEAAAVVLADTEIL